jgi:hypothetical protein
MLDSDGDGAVSLKELLDAVRDCSAAHHSAIAQDKIEVLDVLTKV